MGRHDQRQRRPARAPGRARRQGRRVEPEHGGVRLQRADRAGQGRPAARHVLVAAEPAGVDRGRAQPHGLRRAGRRQPGHLQPRVQDGLLRPAGDGGPSGRRVGELDHPAARGQAPEDGRVPDAGRPVHDPDLRGHREDPLGRRHRDRLPQDLHGRSEQLRLDRQRGQGEEPRPRRRGHAVRGRHRHDARAQQGRLRARSGCTRPTRRRSAASTPTASARRTPRACSTR